MPDLLMHEAAAALGVSYDTVKRRVKRGELPGHKDERGRWLVTLVAPACPGSAPAPAPAAGAVAPADAPAESPVPEHAGAASTAPADAEPARAAAPAVPGQPAVADLLAALRDEVAFLRGRVEEAERERAELRRLLAAAVSTHQLPEAATAPDAPTAAQNGSDRQSPARPAEPPQSPPAGRWGRLLRWFGVAPAH